MSFDAIAPYYRWLEWITAGSLLQRCRTQFISELVDARNILLLGEGRGRFLTELLQANPDTHITCVDASKRMLKSMERELRKRRLSTNHVRFVQVDILYEDWNSQAESYDAVASHFFLDCFRPDQLEFICSKVGAATRARATWLISDFCVPEEGWQRMRARCILWGLYQFFRVTAKVPSARLTAPDRFLEAAGFQLQDRRHFSHGLLHSDIWTKVGP